MSQNLNIEKNQNSNPDENRAMSQARYEKFELMMNAIDDEFLLEAMQEPDAGELELMQDANASEGASGAADEKKKAGLFGGSQNGGSGKGSSLRRWILRGGLVACCLVLVFTTGKFISPNEDVAHATTLEEIEANGYDMSLPEGAENASYYWVERSDDDSNADESGVLTGSAGDSQGTSDEAAQSYDVAQAVFTIDGIEYTYRVLMGTDQTDLFVVLNDDADETVWSANDLSIYVERADETSYVGWYDASQQTQWCLSAVGGSDDVLDAAYSLLMSLGFDVGTPPEGAEGTSYRILGNISAVFSAKEPEAVEGITVSDLFFILDGVDYEYRIGIPLTVPDQVPDISETNGNYEVTADTSDESTWVGWCRTAIYYTPGGEGKIVWFDVVPGICYSLTVDGGASEDSLRSMAEYLYTPMQTES